MEGSGVTTWKSVLTSKVFIASAFLLITGAILDNINGQYIHILFPNREPIPDSLFEILPYFPGIQGLSDIANIFSCLLLAIYLFPKRAHKLPMVLAVLGLGYTMRSFLILLNPFGGPLGNHVHYGLTTIHQYGQFPSGHMFLVVAIYFLLEDHFLRRLALISIFIEAISLILSHGHYSIDIVGGWLIAYFSYWSLKGYQAEFERSTK